MEVKIYTIQEQYNNQNNKINAQKSLDVHSEGVGRPSTFPRHGLMGVTYQGVTPFVQERGETGT